MVAVLRRVAAEEEAVCLYGKEKGSETEIGLCKIVS